MSKPEAKGASAREAANVRLAERDDAAAISQVICAAFGAFRDHYTPEAFEVVASPPDEIVSRLDEGPQWVAELGGEIVGTVSVTVENGDLYVRSMAVAPHAQGQGVAHKLLEAIDEYAAGTQHERIFLYTTYFTPGAKQLYEKHGYEWVRDTTAEEWYGVPGLEMDKRIDQPQSSRRTQRFIKNGEFEKFMKNGICPKCEEKEVHLVNHSVVELYIRFFWRTGEEVAQYICTKCGYIEFFVKDESLLPKIAKKFPKV